MICKGKEIFISHCDGFRRYPFAIVEVFNSSGESIGSGFVPNGDALYQSNTPKEEIDVFQLSSPMIDPPFLNSPELATGIRYGNNW